MGMAALLGDYKLIPVTFYKDPKGFGVYVALILSHYFMF